MRIPHRLELCCRLLIRMVDLTQQSSVIAQSDLGSI